MEYKDEKGNILYGFSQTSLDQTSAKLNDISTALKILIIILILLTIGVFVLIEWIAYNNVLTKIIG